MRASDFDYTLPPELIAQHPSPVRDASSMMVVHRHDRKIESRRFTNLKSFLRAGDLLVVNNSKVIPARLRAINAATGGKFELLLLEEVEQNIWWAMVRPAKRAREGRRLEIIDHTGGPTGVTFTVLAENEDGHRKVQFFGSANIFDDLTRWGEIPLPPYIERSSGASPSEDRDRYQTIYAAPPGSVAAPTAGLHFTPSMLDDLQASGIRRAEVTLHVGAGTFAPVKVEELREHRMHEERYELSAATVQAIEETRSKGARVVAVGTTTLRVLESAAVEGDPLTARSGRTRLFVHPPYHFKIVDALLTNFHLPRSTLLMLVSAFAAPGSEEGRALVLKAYEQAIAERYRFFSYGDAMLLI